MMHLKQGHEQHIYHIEALNLETHLEQHLKALGLTEGTHVTILNNQRRGALTIKFRGTRFAIGRRIAEHIKVSEAAYE